MISASIKLANIHYFEALEQLALANLPEMHNKPKLISMPFYNFVCTFVQILNEYSKSGVSNQYDSQVVFNLNSFLVDFYFRKYQTNPNEIYRQLFSLLRSWKKHTENHEEAKLFLSLLTPQRNTVQAVKLFLKFRKTILKSLNQKILQQLSLTHQDTLTITHTLFSHNPEIKNYVTKKINQLFISLKRKLINSAKVNGAVMCEFFMACGERFSQLDVNKIFSQMKSDKKKIVRNVTNVNVQRQKSVSPLKQKRINNIPSNLETATKSNELKYNLSFSEQYASYYSPQVDYLQSKRQDTIVQKQEESRFMSNFEQLENEWKMKATQRQAPINLVRNSLNFFKRKDQEIDQKLNNCKKYHQLHEQNLLQEQIKENIKYPEGWQKFIKTNAKTKKKLMSQRKLQKLQQQI